MDGWSWKHLSRGAKLLLIQTVTNTIPIYAMQTTLLHKGVIQELKKLNRAFLWGSMDGEHHCHPVAWKVMCMEKAAGSLGIRDLATQFGGFRKAVLENATTTK